jgi:hypothetical protein
MTEIAMRDTQLSELIASMQAKLKAMESGERKNEDFEDVEERLKQAENAVEMFRMEFRSLGHGDKAEYREKLKKHKNDLKSIANDLAWLRQNANRAQLMGAPRDQLQGVDLDTKEGLIAHGRKVQDESIAALQRTAGVVANTRGVAADTAVKVQEQTNQIDNFHKNIYEIDDMLERSKEIIRRMMRRTLTNRYIWILIVLILIGIAGIIAIEVNKKDKGSSGDNVP